MAASAAHADSPMAPVPWIKLSESGNIFFKMIPEKAHWEGDLDNRKIIIDREAFGVAYAIDEDGEFKELWRVKGWYAFDLALSRDGRYLVRGGLWASDQENHTDVAIAFYDRGQLLKEYRVKDLIKKPELLEDSVSHYNWRPAVQSTPEGFLDQEEKTYYLVMVDKTSYNFDITTGQIQEEGRDEGALSTREVWAEEEAKARKKGLEIYHASDFHKAYDQHFELRSTEALRGQIYGLHFSGPQWQAELVTRKKYAVPCELEPVFPVDDKETLKAFMSPEEINSALDQFFSHPYVKKRLATGTVKEVDLRFTADRLHWYTETLQELLEKVTLSETPKSDKLHSWADFTLRGKNFNDGTALYFNTQTGEILYEEESTEPLKPGELDFMRPKNIIHLDKTGESLPTKADITGKR